MIVLTIIMIAIVHSIYSQSVHALALNAGSMDNDAERYCTFPTPNHYVKNYIVCDMFRVAV